MSGHNTGAPRKEVRRFIPAFHIPGVSWLLRCLLPLPEWWGAPWDSDCVLIHLRTQSWTEGKSSVQKCWQRAGSQRSKVTSSQDFRNIQVSGVAVKQAALVAKFRQRGREASWARILWRGERLPKVLLQAAFPIACKCWKIYWPLVLWGLRLLAVRYWNDKDR